MNLKELQRETFHSQSLDDYTTQFVTHTDDLDPCDDPELINLVSSKIKDTELHAPALDIDIPCRYVPSSTEDHGHLYFDSLRLTWPQYRTLLDALADAGIVERKYVDHSRRRGMTTLRPENVKKITQR
jgi:hypothetical protein